MIVLCMESGQPTRMDFHDFATARAKKNGVRFFALMQSRKKNLGNNHDLFFNYGRVERKKSALQ